MSGEGRRIRVSASNPCPICGSTDYDQIIDYGEEGSVIWCHDITKTGNVFVGGKEYVCISVGKKNKIGIYNLYQEKEERDRIQQKKRQLWIEEQKKNNPNWKPSKDYKPRKEKSAVDAATVTTYKEVKEDVKALSNKELDERYRYFLSLLVLEDKHKKILYDEWKSDVFPNIYKDLLLQYPLKSLPPKDFIRFKQAERFKNLSRKKITAKMVERFGTCEGIPGFFMNTGEYWDSKPEEERWTFSGGEGIIFPCYDKDGYIWRLRYREDYPMFKFKEGSGYPEGVVFHKYEENGRRRWYFTEKGKKKAVPVEELSFKIPFKANGCPAVGKAQGKYKTLSSWYEKDEGNYVVNAFFKGCKSGSPYSLYAPKYANWTICLLTEGEKKGMVSSYVKNCPVVSFAGVGTWSSLFEQDEYGISLYDKLKRKGVRYFVTCYDADKALNEMVSGAEKDLVLALKERGELPLVGEWQGKFSKGMDDIMLLGIDLTINQLGFGL